MSLKLIYYLYLQSTPTALLQKTETPTTVTLESFALRNVTSRCNVAATRTQGSYIVPANVVATVLFWVQV